MFAAVRERFGVERDDTLSLREFPTLAHVIGWVRDKTAIAARSRNSRGSRAGQGEPHPAAPRLHPATVVGDLDAVDALRGGCPCRRCDPPLDRCVPTGRRPRRGTRVVVMRDRAASPTLLGSGWPKAGVTSSPWTPDWPPTDPARPWTPGAPRARSRASTGCRAGRRGPAGRARPGRLAGGPAPSGEGAVRRVMRRLYDDKPFLVAGHPAGRLPRLRRGRRHRPAGRRGDRLREVVQAERPGALVKAVDLPLDAEDRTVADLLVAETLRDPGCVEVGYADGRALGRRPGRRVRSRRRVEPGRGPLSSGPTASSS